MSVERLKSDLAPGAQLGSFVIEETLGRGGMGVVYRARDIRSGQKVALKLLLAHLARDDRFRERFMIEVAAAQRIQHPGLVAIQDAGLLPGGDLFMALELLPGDSLDDSLGARGTIPWREALSTAAEVARALGALHAAKLVHRDLKPANVLLDRSGRPRLADLGLVRGVQGSSLVAGLTKTGELVGTIQYMAPEQLEDARTVGPPADLYALGVLLYELLTGVRPFEGTPIEIMKQHITDAPVAPSRRKAGLPSFVDAAVLELLAKSPDARGASAEAVAAKLEELAKAPEPRRLPWALVGALVVGLGAIGAAATYARTSPPEPPTRAPPPPPPARADWFSGWQLDKRAPARARLGGLRPNPDVPGEYVDDRTGLRLVWVPQATATIGNMYGPTMERPLHRVIVDELFLGKYEVTHAEFERFVQATKYATDAEKQEKGYVLTKYWDTNDFEKKPRPGLTWRHPLGPGGPEPPPDHPVVLVSWQDAIEYCRWASEGLKRGAFDLPSEAEWERAASWDVDAGKARRYPWGNATDLTCVALLDPTGGKTDDEEALRGPLRTRPVGSLPRNASPVGAFDMAGSVYEWCADTLVDGAYETRAEKRSPEVDPIDRGVASSPLRMVRAGSTSSNWGQITCFHRTQCAPLTGYIDLGFRVALVTRKPVWKR